MLGVLDRIRRGWKLIDMAGMVGRCRPTYLIGRQDTATGEGYVEDRIALVVLERCVGFRIGRQKLRLRLVMVFLFYNVHVTRFE